MTERFSFSRSAQPFSLPPAPFFIIHQTCFWSALHCFVFVWFFLKKKRTHKNPKKTPQKQNQGKKKTTQVQKEKERKKRNPAGLKFSDDKAEGNRLIPSMKAAQKDKMQRGGKKKSIWASCTGMKWLLSFLLPAPMLHVDITHPVLQIHPHADACPTELSPASQQW